MPTNLNALIRYKQIDACLRNLYVRCTIERLQDVCSEAMGEHRGIYKQVSERTIREDIRVMRSNILGFNAPIKYKNGAFHYTEKDYSIFSTPVTEVNLLRDILKMLLEERNNIADAEVDKLLKRISVIVGEPLPFEEGEKETLKFMPPPEEAVESIRFSESEKLPKEKAYSHAEDDDEHIDEDYKTKVVFNLLEPIDDNESKEENNEFKTITHSDKSFSLKSLFRKESPKEVLMLWNEILKVV